MDTTPPNEQDTNQKADPEHWVFEPSWFNSLTGNSDKAMACAGLAIDNFASQVRTWPDWTLETEPPVNVCVQVHAHRPANHLILSIQRHDQPFDQPMLLTLIPDQSGWLRLTVHWTVESEEVLLFEGWLDQPYEEFEFWPTVRETAAASRVPDLRQIAPGRMGKRMNWICIEADAWGDDSLLQALGNSHGFVIASHTDES